MTQLQKRDELQAYYQKGQVVREYLRRRTAQPLNGCLHRSQVRFLNTVLRHRAPAHVLEIAPGPGRLTAEVEMNGTGVVVDTSPGMLATASARLREKRTRWHFVRADSFRLPFPDGAFDFVYTLKFVRHFALPDRQQLYGEIRRVLRPDGVFVLDAQNRAVSLLHRQRKGLAHYPIYDVLYDRQELVDELQRAGFRVVSMRGLIKHFAWQVRLNRLRRLGLDGVARVLIAALDRFPTTQPSTWMVLNEVASGAGPE